MDSPSPLDTRTIKAKKTAPPLPTPAMNAPTTFFLKKEKDMEKNSIRGRSLSQASSQSTGGVAQSTPQRNAVGDSSFGVESLEDTIRSPVSSEHSISRSTSQSSERSSDSSNNVHAEGRILSRKRKAGNRVHPSILAAGRRIISSDYNPGQASSCASPASIPFTPTKSPRPAGSITPSTPRSASPKSFRLSDEDSMADDHSQAVVSSSGDEDVRGVERTPQLVMPSLPLTARKPFTHQGRQLGRAKVMVVGPRKVGKTSFIRSLIRSTEHIVHVDNLRPAASESSFDTDASAYRSTTLFPETQASTRPFPPFWTEVDHKRSRSNSIGSGILERNLTFIDTPGLGGNEDIEQVLAYVKNSLRRTMDVHSMSDAEIVSLLSGDGGVQIDAVFYLFAPAEEDTAACSAQQDLIKFLCRWTNVIPIISQADNITTDALRTRKQQIRTMLHDLQSEPHSLLSVNDGTEVEQPLAVSSALGVDEDMMDASVLMSSQYMQPLVPSELAILVESFFEQSNFARMRHQSATKFVLWKREHAMSVVVPTQTYPGSARSPSPSTGSLLEETNKVMVPHSSSSYYRSSSPAVSDGYVPPGGVGTSDFTLARHNEQAQPAEPLRQMRLVKWAQDLQRGLENERRKYRELYNHRPAEWKVDDEEKNEKQALVSTSGGTRPARGRLGGDIGIIDPLGVLAFGQVFGRRSLLTLQLVSGFGLLGAAAYWIFRNWITVQDYFYPTQPTDMVSAAAMSMRRHGMNLVDDIRVFFGWER